MKMNLYGALRAASRLALLAAAWTGLTLGGVLLLNRETATLSREGSGLLRGLFLDLFHLRTMPTTLAAPWFFEALGVAAGGTLVVRGFSSWLDPASYAADALRWSFRTLPCLLLWAAIALAVALPLAHFDAPGALFVLELLAYLALPFVCLREVIASRERPPFFWGPRWPGFPAVVFAVLALTAAEALPGLAASVAGWVPLPPSLDWILIVVASLPAVVLSWMTIATAVLSWLGRWKLSRIRASLFVRPLLPPARVIGALELQSYWLMILLVVPLALGFAATLDLATAYTEPFTHVAAAQLPFHQRALLQVTRFLISWWWMGALLTVPPVCWWLAWNARARAMHLAQAGGPAADA